MAPFKALPVGFQARVLIVEERSVTAKVLSRELAALGVQLEMLVSPNGNHALRQIQTRKVDLLVVDMTLSDMTGLEFIEKARANANSRQARIVLMTAYDLPTIKTSAEQYKIDAIVLKPAKADEFAGVVAESLSRIAQANAKAEAEVAEKAGEKEPLKILIADDWPDNVTLLTRFLTSSGYTCIKAADGVEALLKTRSELPDLILLDVNMPEMNGMDTLREIRADETTRHIPVIILTAARTDKGDMQAGLALGANDYMTKPFDRRDLLGRIHKLIKQK